LEVIAGQDTVRVGEGKPYYRVLLRRPADPLGPVFGEAVVAFPETPFNVAVNRSGYYVYDLFISADGVRPRPGMVHMAWVADPELEHVKRAGVLERGGGARERVDFGNKFLVFVTEEGSAEVDRPTGRIVLRGTSRSGRMESMFSHGFCPPDTQC